MPIEHGDSWFSPKCIEVQPGLNTAVGGRALFTCGGFTAYQWLANCECQQQTPGVRRRVRMSVVKRATTQTAS
jgi:hypothetical protein